jgi:hypothetical protein
MLRNLKESARHGGVFIAGAAIPFAAVCIWLFAAGVFHNFWFWTFKYASQYVTETPLSQAFEQLIQGTFTAAGPYLWLWLLGIMGSLLSIIDRNAYKHPYFISGLLFSTFLSICPGFYFRPHYFITMLPALAVSAALFITSLSASAAKSRYPYILSKLPFMLVAANVLLILAFQYNFFGLSPQEACRNVYGVNPFPEAIRVAEYIKSNTRPGDNIAVIGSEPEIYFYSGRRSATGFIYTYSLVEKGNYYSSVMQRQFAREVMGARPAYLVFVHGSNSWCVPERDVKKALWWSKPFCDKFYKPGGVVEIFYGNPARYCLKDGADCKNPASKNYLCIYKRADYKGPADR